jgi:hypothetical protein
MIKGRLRFGLSVAILENPLFWLLLVISSIFLLILSQLFFARGLVKYSELKFSELDNNLAEIIQKLLEEGPISIDPENQITPIQAFFMDMIKQKMNPAIQVKEIVQQRDESGKFT